MRDEGDNPLNWALSISFLKIGISCTLLGSLAFLVVLLLGASDQVVRASSALLLMLAAAVSGYCLRRGRVYAAVMVLTLGAWSTATVSAFFFGGVRTPAIILYPLIVALAGWLLSSRMAWIMSVLSVAAIIGFALLESIGLLPQPPVTLPAMYGVVQVTMVVLVAALVVSLVRSYHGRLDELRLIGLERDERTRSLEAREAELHKAQAVAKVGSWVYDIASCKLQLSAETRRIFSMSEGTYASTEGYLAMTHVQDRSNVERAWQALLQGERLDLVHRIVVGGAIRWIHQNAELSLDAHGSPWRVVGISQDITEQQRSRDELIAAKANAEKANLAKSRFLAAASHDLRQPLSALALYVGVLGTRVAPGEGELVTNIRHCVDSLSELLTDLLDLSKLDAGVVTPKPSNFAVDDMLTARVAIHTVEAGLKGLSLRFRPSGAFAYTDQPLLSRIIGNLIVNAIRYTYEGGVLIACRRHDGKDWIEVWDTGIGIPADQTEAVFEEFNQLGDDRRGRGSGLGLAIVARSAALLGLPVRLRSRVGRGSMFAIGLPAGQVIIAPAAPAPRRAARSLRLGIVENDPRVMQALVFSMQAAGHEVVGASNGAELLAQLGKKAPDIVISDYRLDEGETGFNVISAARACFTSNLPAIMITGDTDPAVIRSMSRQGIAIHYKPLQLDTLQASIWEAVDRRDSAAPSPTGSR